MLDINLIREKPNLVKASEKKRGKDIKIVDRVLTLDKQWRQLKQEVDNLRHKRNQISQEINQAKKKSKDIKGLIQEAKQIPDKIREINRRAEKLIEERDSLRYQIGNILHKTVPQKDKVIRTSGKKTTFKFKPKSHVDLLKDLDLADTEKASQVSGTRFYYLKNELVILNFALQKFAFDLLMKKKYKPIFTPFMLTEKAMRGASELADFRDQLYKIEGEDLYLVATAEQSIIAYHYNEMIPESKLPLKYVGFSTNFRKEAGSHGKDTKGIFRIHQFDKVEQIIFSTPENSWKFHEEMTKNSEEIFKKLKIPYRIVNISAKEMNDNGSKKYDLEAWFPFQKQYREVGSGTNCTDYQARKSKIRLARKNKIEFPHILNCTAIATERVLACILENYQQKDGSVKVPECLQKYAGFRIIKPKQAKIKKQKIKAKKQGKKRNQKKTKEKIKKRAEKK